MIESDGLPALENIDLGLVGARIDSFSISNPENLPPGMMAKIPELRKKQWHDTSFRHGFHLEKEQMVVTVIAKVLLEYEKEMYLVAECQASFYFFIGGLGKMVEMKKGKITKHEISDPLLMTCYTVAYSSARGMFFTKSMGTFMHGILLPLVDPTVLLSPKEEE